MATDTKPTKSARPTGNVDTRAALINDLEKKLMTKPRRTVTIPVPGGARKVTVNAIVNTHTEALAAIPKSGASVKREGEDEVREDGTVWKPQTGKLEGDAGATLYGEYLMACKPVPVE